MGAARRARSRSVATASGMKAKPATTVTRRAGMTAARPARSSGAATASRTKGKAATTATEMLVMAAVQFVVLRYVATESPIQVKSAMTARLTVVLVSVDQTACRTGYAAMASSIQGNSVTTVKAMSPVQAPVRPVALAQVAKAVAPRAPLQARVKTAAEPVRGA